MPDANAYILSLNHDIRQAVLAGEHAQAAALDQIRYDFIAALDLPNDALQNTLRATLSEVHALTQTLEHDLIKQGRKRQSAAQAQRAYIQTSAHPKEVR